MEVTAQDRPGLLLQVANALLAFKMRLVTAKDSTFGESAEDVFFITDRDGQPVTDAGQHLCISEMIRTAIPASNPPPSAG